MADGWGGARARAGGPRVAETEAELELDGPAMDSLGDLARAALADPRFHGLLPPPGRGKSCRWRTVIKVRNGRNGLQITIKAR